MQTAPKTRAKAPTPNVVAENTAAAFQPYESPFDGVVIRVAVYARYSTDGQKETSIDDQIRCCEETASRYGLTVSKSLIFADDAITGAAKATHKRDQWHALRAAVRAGKVDVIICDQQCRLARSAKESLDFFDDLKMHNVRLLSADGFDSEHPTAKLLFGIKSVFGEFFLDETRHRVRRGMVGEFERGSMVTAVPYGYQVDVVRSAKEGRCVWAIDPEPAEVVREVFRCRKGGMSCSQIAAILNGRKVPTPHGQKKKGGCYWRSTALWRIVGNPIYKGLYVVNFRCEKGEERPVGQRLMPDLALVSVADWDACQSEGRRNSEVPEEFATGRRRRGGYGGGKHPLAGIIRCGVCGAYLSCHHAKTDAGSMCCTQCQHATSDGVRGRKPMHLSLKGVRLMLQWLLQKIVAGEAIERYRACLRERLAGGHDGELVEARQMLEKAERSRGHLGRLLRTVGGDDPVLDKEFMAAREEVLHLEHKVRELENGLRRLNQTGIQKQLDIDLSQVVSALLSDRHTPERTRALLNRIFPSITLKWKTDRYTAIFRVEVKPGTILAEASDTAELIDGNEVIWVQLQTSGSKYPTWFVEEIPPPESGGDSSLSWTGL